MQPGRRVSTAATNFDTKNGHSWSIAHFGDSWKTAKCLGTIKKVFKSKNIAVVKWDIDGKVTKISCNAIVIADSPESNSLTYQGVDENSSPKKKPRLADGKSTRGSSSGSSDSDSSSSSDLNSDDQVSDELFPNTTTNDEEPVNNEPVFENNNQVTVHDTTWTFGETVTINAFKDAQYKPQLHVRNIQNMTELDFWFAFFPSEDIDLIIQSTNAKLRERRKMVTRGELYKALGIMYAMTVNSLHTKRDYWNTESRLFPAPAFGQRFGMGLHRFEEIINCLSFALPDEAAEVENEDNWYQVRAFYDMTTSKWNDIFTPGYKLTVDESMFAWYGKGLYNEKDGMPAVIKIQRKPKGVGCECKTIADVQSGIMIGLEINEGKQSMQRKEWQRDLGAGTATTLRLTRPWHGSGRIVVGDSWFGSVKTAIELYKRGLYFLGMVKTATKNYPIQEARRRCPPERGQYVAATSIVTEPHVKLVCVAWRDKKIHTFIGTCSTTLEGEPAKKKRTDATGRMVVKEVQRIKLVQDYFDSAPAIDIHNHIRQSGLALEEAWNTQKWQHRMFASMFGIIEANAYLAYKYFKKDFTKKHSDFTECLALQLINNPWTGVLAAAPAAPAAPAVSVHGQRDWLPGEHTLIALSSEDNRQRVQRKCIICSRIRHFQQKSSYRCSSCGVRAVICSPTTGRNCFAYHIQHGIPA